jgi:hypothetical protein
MMKKITFLLLIILCQTQSSFPWGGTTHRGMTKAAAEAIIPLLDDKPDSFSVAVKYNMMIDFFQTIFKGMGTEASGLLFSAIGAIADLAISEDRYDIDTTMKYGNMTELEIISEAGQDPDDFDDGTGIFGNGKCLVGHMCAPNGLGFADYMVNFFYEKAVASYKKGKRLEALVYLGYACHYLVDVGLPVHAEANFLNQKNIQAQWEIHSKIEDWISNNWEYSFQKIADEAAKAPLPVCDIQAMVRSLGLETYEKLSEWYKAWDVSSANTSEPRYKSDFMALVKEQIWRTVPRASGLFLKFKKEVNYSTALNIQIIPMKIKKK